MIFFKSSASVYLFYLNCVYSSNSSYSILACSTIVSPSFSPKLFDKFISFFYLSLSPRFSMFFIWGETGVPTPAGVLDYIFLPFTIGLRALVLFEPRSFFDVLILLLFIYFYFADGPNSAFSVLTSSFSGGTFLSWSPVIISSWFSIFWMRDFCSYYSTSSILDRLSSLCDYFFFINGDTSSSTSNFSPRVSTRVGRFGWDIYF